MTGVESIRTYLKSQLLEVQDSMPKNIEKWAMSMDWSALRCLHVESPDTLFLRTIAGQIPDLKFLTLTNWRIDSEAWANAAMEFLLGRPI